MLVNQLCCVTGSLVIKLLSKIPAVVGTCAVLTTLRARCVRTPRAHRLTTTAHGALRSRRVPFSPEHARSRRFLLPLVHVTLVSSRARLFTGLPPPSRTHFHALTPSTRLAQAVRGPGLRTAGGGATRGPRDKAGHVVLPRALFRPVPPWPLGALSRAAPGPLASRSHFGAQVCSSARPPGEAGRGEASADRRGRRASADRKFRRRAGGGAVTPARRKWPWPASGPRLQ